MADFEGNDIARQGRVLLDLFSWRNTIEGQKQATATAKKKNRPAKFFLNPQMAYKKIRREEKMLIVANK